MAAGNASGRSRLSMFELIQDGILAPGEKLLTFDYMVSCFVLIIFFVLCFCTIKYKPIYRAVSC